MPPPPSGPPPIPSFVITYYRTYGQYFVRQGTRQQHLDNSLSSLSNNGRPYNGPVYNDKVNRLNWLLVQMLLILFVVLVCHSKNQGSQPIGMISSFKSVMASAGHHTKSTHLRHPSLSKEEMISGWRLVMDYWADTGCSVKHAYVGEFFEGNSVNVTVLTYTLVSINNLPIAHLLYEFDK